uniref:Uncharacterized protein n=1 Tax=Lepeophtheirus salmonis TaxID=72036 RepID=A0A0K2THS6_LEPSM
MIRIRFLLLFSTLLFGVRVGG